MKPMTKLLIVFAITTSFSYSQDPIVTDGDKYKSIFENETVRVLEYTDKPGDLTTLHHHPDFVLYALDPFKRKLTFSNGKSIERDFKKGEVIYMKDQKHIGENIGKTNTHVIIVELKNQSNTETDSTGATTKDKKWNLK